MNEVQPAFTAENTDKNDTENELTAQKNETAKKNEKNLTAQKSKTESENEDKPTAQKSGRKKSSLAAGLIVIVFAVVGLACSIIFAVNKIVDYTKQKEQIKFNEYSSLLISAAAIDIAPFDDITGADMKELVEMSVWSIIGSAENPNSFEYKSGSLVVPAEAVESAFTHFFGTQRTIEHMTVQGYGYEFTYNTTENAYYIPITSLTPLYTPKVTDIEKKGNAVTVTVGMVNSDKWLQNSETGDLSTPAPDKYVKVTFREESGNRYISAVRTLSAPETATIDTANVTAATGANETANNETTTADGETTTAEKQ